MHYLTISEYARMTGQHRQSVQYKIRKGKLALAKRKVDAWLIPVEDTEYEKIKENSLQDA